MEPQRIGTKEALVLLVLTGPSTISDVCDRLEGERIDDAGVYLALKRLTDRKLISRRTVSRIAADGKKRDVGEYRPTPAALEALKSWMADVGPAYQRAVGALA